MARNILDLQVLADAGNKEALFLLGEMFDKGDGVSKNSTRALYYYSLASEFGVKKADILIGRAYELGDGCEKNAKLAANYYLSSGEFGFPKGYTALGKLLESEKIFDAEPIKYYRKAADAGDPEGAFLLGKAYFEGAVVERSLPLAKKYLSFAARGDVPSAAYFMALITLEEGGDVSDAAKFFEVAAKAGNIDAAVRFADYLFYGKGIPVDEVSAYSLWNTAYFAGDTRSFFPLALCNLDGKGCNQNRKRGIDFLEKSVKCGNADAMFILANLYEHGKDGYTENLEKSAFYYKISAEKGNADSLAHYGKMLILGVGEPANIEKAFQMITESEAKGSHYGSYYLGYCYEKGFGSEINFKRAMQCYGIAKEYDILDAKERFSLIEARLKC